MDSELLKLKNFNLERTPPLVKINLTGLNLKQFDTKGYFGKDALIYHTEADLKDSADMIDLSIQAA